ncbi:type 1 glutamine amidotransferase [Myxacorys almedinensis]|uniref:Type 1 glutamine amidotransferase n=1 Tax=Myxacorys almedinensis A TaxID=2690445 RepID=A0A8J7ZCF3_9CYAN|nr:type 1 glutamine amidotransferase [Myxacorys almedinensis]NDJ19395.1 type 1 glutamine amidotransferase [Myxacorys almedinensis A]
MAIEQLHQTSTLQKLHLNILLLQIREDELTRQEEFDEFVRYSRLDPSQFQVLDTFLTPEFEPSIIHGFDALFIGGSSDVSVLQPDLYPFITPMKKLLVYCLQQEIPVLASCFGFQAAVEALGGQVMLDKANLEMGIYPMWLTEAAAEDALFHDMPNGFWAVSGHKERAVVMPKGAVLLAYSDRCPFHAFKIPGKPFYGFQFHPEVDAQDLAVRVVRYQSRYLDSDEQVDCILRDLQDTAIANQLIEKFVDRIVLQSDR